MFEQKDLIHLKNLQRLLGKMKVELDMQEILAAGDVIRWLANLSVRIETDIKNKAVEKQVVVSQPAIKEEPKAEKKTKKAKSAQE